MSSANLATPGSFKARNARDNADDVGRPGKCDTAAAGGVYALGGDASLPLRRSRCHISPDILR